jgi:hypothetical protein
MAFDRHCSQCDCAGRIVNGRPNDWVCANHPEHPGQLVLVASGDGLPEDAGPCCRSFRVRRETGGVGPAGANDAVRCIGLGGGLFAIVDASDFQWLSRYRWRATGGEAGYPCCRIGGKKVYMHRLIVNAPDGRVVDHANGNRWDNRRDNLRICTQGENLRNRRKWGGSSRFKGVFWDPVRRKWRVLIRCNGKTVHMGRYADEVQAAMAYDRAARRLFGVYARLNFPEPGHAVRLRGRIRGRGRVRGRARVVKSDKR